MMDKRFLTDEEIGFGQELEGVAQPAKPKILSDSDIGFEAPKPSAFESVKDSAIALGTGVTQGIGMLANVAGADNAVSRTMADATQALSEYESPHRKAEKQERARKIKEAEESGSTLKEVGAYLGSFAEAPIDTTLNALGTSLPTLAAGFIPGAGQAAVGARIAQLGLGAAQGVGAVKGQIFDEVKQAWKEKGATEEDAAARAAQAQSYTGDNAGSIALGGALGTVAGSSGAEASVRRLAGKEVAERAAQTSVLKGAGMGALKEAPMEGLQGGQERLTSNLALQNEGFDQGTWTGVAGGAALEATASAPMGAGFGAWEVGSQQRLAQQEQQRRTEIEQQLQAIPEHQQPAARAQLNAELNAQLQAEARAAGLMDEEQGQTDVPPGGPSDYRATPAWAKPPADAAPDYGNADDEIFQSTGTTVDPVREAVRQAADAGGALSAAAGVAMDSGAAPTFMPPADLMQQAAPEEDPIVLQNRERNSAASIAQMQEIAASPDYLRVGPSRDMTSGAPIVFGDLPPTAVLGRQELVVDGNGQRVGTQYAVVDAGDLIASNRADGSSVAEYATGVRGKLRSVAGNGRTAGLQAAYDRGTAQGYRQDLLADAASIGVDAQALTGMQRPVLVRVMSQGDVTADMGDRTNITGTQKLSPVEQAANDARRFDIANLAFDEGGNPTAKSIAGFVSSMPVSEQGDMMNPDGSPTRQAVDRLMAATFKQAYDSDELVQLYAQAADPDARAVLSAAADASGVMAALSGTDFDVRQAVADAVKMAVNASRQGLKLSDVLQNADFDMNPEAYPVASFLAQNIRSPKAMAEGLRRWGQLALQQARVAEENKYQGNLLGDPTPTLSRQEIFARIGDAYNPTEQAVAARAQPQAPVAEQASIDPTQPSTQSAAMPVPGNFSGTPSATMGARTDAVAGPGFGATDLQSALAQIRARKQQTQQPTEAQTNATTPINNGAQAAPTTSAQNQAQAQAAPQQAPTWATMPAEARQQVIQAAGLNKPQATKALATNSIEEMPADIADKLAPVLSSAAGSQAQPERAQDVALTNEGELANAADTPADQFGVMALPEQIKEYLLKPSVTMRQDGKTISAKDYIDGLLADGYGNPEYFSAPKGSQAGFLSKPGKPKVTLNDKQMLYADAAFMAKKGKSGSKPNQPPARTQQAQAATEDVADDGDGSQGEVYSTLKEAIDAGERSGANYSVVPLDDRGPKGKHRLVVDSKEKQPQGQAQQDASMARTAAQRINDAVRMLQETRNSMDALVAMHGDGLDPDDDVIEVIQRAASGFDAPEKKKLNKFLKENTKRGKKGTYITNARQLFDLLPEHFGYNQWLLHDAINDLSNEAQNQPAARTKQEQAATENVAPQPTNLQEGIAAAQKKAKAKDDAPPADDLNAMFDELMAETDPQAPAPKAQPKAGANTARKPRTAAQAAGSAVKNTAAALNNAIDGLGALFGAKSGGRMGSGLSFDEGTYAQAKPLFIQAVSNLKEASADIREAMRAVINMVTAKFGRDVTENMKPYIVRFVSDVRDGTISQEELNAPSTNANLERDSNEPATEPAVVPAVPGDAGAVSGNAGRTGGQAAGAAGRGQPGDSGLPTGGTAADGERSDFSVSGRDAAADAARIATGSDFSERGSDIGVDGVSVDPVPAKEVGAVASKPLDRLAKAAQQREAEKVPVKPGDLENIKATLPYLLEGQQEDVLKTEARFSKPDGYGMLFTNGTGTGKTFTGLGVVKRMARQGKNNVLIVVPDDKIAADWVESGVPLGLNISKLQNTKSAGSGIVITTYANLGDNDALARRQWDMVVADEAHTLMQSADGAVTGYLANLRAITHHPDGAYQRHTMLNRKDIDALAKLSEQIQANIKILNSNDTMDAMMVSVRAENERLQKEADALTAKLREAQEAVQAEVKGMQGAKRARLLALSATPFAYEFTVDWANGYLFDYNEGQASDKTEFRGYNQGSNKDRFFMANFGYTMRYNKLTRPDPTKVDTGLLQRNFNVMLRKSGALSSRMLDVAADYDRRFVLVDSGIGNQIDDALNWLNEQRLSAEQGNMGYSALADLIHEKFDYLSRRYLLEAIKATEVIPIVRQHMAMGRKVVVFHDYKKGGGFNPFNIKVPSEATEGTSEENAQALENLRNAVIEFRAKFKELVEAPLGELDSPIEVFKREFADVLLVNGDEKKAALLERYKRFQDDASGPQVMLVQSAKNKGWSGHDTTGKHQRVLINLGQPTAPTMAIQQEGRIYRTGQVTDAIMRYLNTGTSWERMTFAQTIAGRASAAENLGMGEQARALKDSFINAFEESDTYAPGHDGEGKGGKERDKMDNATITAFDRAKTYYWGSQKKTSKTKAQEGKDYFATPEPLGLKMAEWLDLRGSESALEPSAGHGAIARWLPETANRTAIEPSNTLRARLALAMDASKDRLIDGTFEAHAIVNKYDGIVMNPPFGVGGKTAIEHLDKASKHLRDGGRIVALIPTGPAADKRFDQWMNGESERPTKPLYTHPEHGPIYKGDTVETRASWAPVGIVKSYSSEYGVAVQSPKNPSDVTSVSAMAIKSVKPTGQRTETYRASEGIYQVAEIKLPQVTFERAGTAVATRIVILEKQTDAARAPNARAPVDLTDITDINKLFDRIENMNVQPRAMTAEQERAGNEAKASEAKASKADATPATQPKAPKAANPAAVGTVDRGGAKVITHTTGAGKTIHGIVKTDWTLAQARAVDPYTFKKNGGFFIREAYLKPEGDTANYAATNPTRPGSAQDKAVMQAIADGKNARDVLRVVASGSKDPFLRQVAKMLLKAGITPNIEFGHIGKDKKGNPIHGQYRGKSDTIAIAGSAEYAVERIFMHEAMHAATMRALKKPGLVKLQLQKLMAHVQKQKGAAGFYGMQNVDEFVAEVFTNPDFQAALRKMSAPAGNSLKSAWHSFVRILRSILGLSNDSSSALAQALELGVEAVRQDMVLRRQGAQATRTANAGQDGGRGVGDADPAEARRVQSAIEGKSLLDAARFLTQSSNKARAAVAQKVLEKLERLELAGVSLQLNIVHRGDMAPAAMANARGYTETGFDSKGRDIAVWLNGADVTGKVGTEEEVLLHELVHATTSGMVFYGRNQPKSLTGKHVRDLMAVTDTIANHISQRFTDADAGKATLTEFEQDMRAGANNAFRSDDEVLAWALTNSEAQQYLETIPYKSGSLWSNFVQSVRSLLGLSPANDTALSEVLRVSERLLTDDAPDAGRAAFWHKRGLPMVQQQGRGSQAFTSQRGDGNSTIDQTLTDAQRRATPPSQTADVADSDVIVMFNGKVAMSAPTPANAAPDAPATAQPLRTPAATIRAAITKAYGKLLGQLESKGLVTLAQTEAQAVEAAAHARAKKTGGDVAQIKRSLTAAMQGDTDLDVKRSAALSGITFSEDVAASYAGQTNHTLTAKSKNDVAGVLEYVVYEGVPSISMVSVSEKNRRQGIGRALVQELQSKFPDIEIEWGMLTEDGAALRNSLQFEERPNIDVQRKQNQLEIAVAERSQLEAEANKRRDSDDYSAWIQTVSERWNELHDEIDELESDLAAAGPAVRRIVVASETQQSPASIDIKRSSNGAVQGFFDPQTGQSFLIADNLSAEAAPGVLMHEVGIHMAADGSMKALFNRAAMMLKLQNGNPFIKAVQARMDAAGETSGEEAAAYIAEAYENDRANAPASVQRWLADLLAAVKAWMFKKGIMGADRLTVADVAAVARANAKSMARASVADRTGDGDIQFSRASQAINNTLNERKTVMAGPTSRAYTPEQQAAMRNVGLMVEQPSLKERAQALWQDAGKKLAQGIVDQFAPVKEISKDAYALLRLSKGASGAFETLLKGGKLKLSGGVYDFDEANKGGVVDALLTPLNGEHHDFLRWVAANRAERLMGEDRERLFTPDDIAALKTLADGQLSFDFTLKNGPRKGETTRSRAEAYKDSLTTFNAFNKNVLDMAEQSGLIDPDSRATWESEFYVPFYRVADEESGGVRGMNIKGSVVRQQAFKHLKGGKQALNNDLLDNTLMNWAHLLDASAKNRAAKATLEAAQQVGVAIEAPKGTLDNIASAIGKKNGIVWFMDGGQKRHFMVDDPYIMTAISSLEYAGMNSPIMNAMGAFKHALTIGVTASPFFKIRNLIRDSVQVVGTSSIGVNPLKNVADGWKLTDPKNDAYFRLLAGGGTIHFGAMLEGSEAKRVQALVESGVKDSTILNTDHKVKQFYRKYIEPGITAYNELGNRGEAVNRAALYDQLRKQGMSHAEASLQARDLMDFSMQGSFTSIRFLSQVVPFLNARLQGMYKLGRAANENPKRMAYVTGAVAMASLALLAAYGDDDDWKRREDWDRNNFWWFKVGGIAFRIPKPFELGAIGTLAERSAEYLMDDEMTGKRFRGQVLKLLGDNLSMNPIPQAVKPLLDVYANKDSFRNAPIESMGMERMKSEYRFNDRTSMVARGMSTAANSVTGLVGAEALSPVQIDHLLRGYFGWLGTFAVGTADMIARPVTNQPTQATQDIWKKVTGGIASQLEDAPSRYVSSVYDQAKELEQAFGTWRALQKSGKPEEAAAFFADNREEIARYRSVTQVKSAESKLNERIRQIERNEAMDGDQKREEIRRIRAMKEALAKQLAPA